MPLLLESSGVCTLAKKIDDQLKTTAIRQVNDHQGEHSSLTAAASGVAQHLCVGKESVRAWVLQAQIDGGRAPVQLTRGIFGIDRRIERLLNDEDSVK